jgi:hypothetical protein
MNDQITPIKEERVISLALWKAVVIVFVAVLGSAGASIWTTINVFNTVPFRVTAVETEILTVKQAIKDVSNTYMSLAVSNERWKVNDEQHKEIISKLDRLTTAVNDLYRAVR